MHKQSHLLNLPKSHETSSKQISEKSSTSETSLKNKTERHTKRIKMVSKLQIQDLNDKVKYQLQKNNKSYQKLIGLNPYFSMKLYNPDNNFNSDQYNSQSVSLMMRQLQLLLDDGHILQKQIMKTQMRKMQNDYKDNHDIDQWRHHYAHLKKVWTNPKEEEANKPFDIIEQLNKKVVIIKSSITGMISQEKKCYENNRNSGDQYENVTRKINQVVHSVEEYRLLKEKYQNLMMSYQDLTRKFENHTEKMNQKMEEKNQILDKIRQENDELKKSLKESKQKLLFSQEKQASLLTKMKDMEFKQKQKKEDKSKLQTSMSQSSLKPNQLLNFEYIKFTKLDTKDLFQVKLPESKSTRRRHNTTFTFESRQEENEQPVSKPLSCQEQSAENFNRLNNHIEEISVLDLSTARSIDKFRGKFTRMRSPCNGKLLKVRDEDQRRKSEFLSPKTTENKRYQQVVASQN